MAVTIPLPDKLEARLQQRARMQNRTVAEVAVQLLERALDIEEFAFTPEQVVAQIRALPPNLENIRPAQGSLAEALRTRPVDEEFDLAAWNRAWQAVEAEMKAITRANDLAEGRRDDLP